VISSTAYDGLLSERSPELEPSAAAVLCGTCERYAVEAEGDDCESCGALHADLDKAEADRVAAEDNATSDDYWRGE
jgi:methionyl-tRNA synthetase